MAKRRREFSPEFKRETVALLESSGRPVMQVAAEVGISPSMLRNWRAVVRGRSARSRAAPSPGIPPLPSAADQASEITRLKRELDRTRMERDVLKKSDRHLRGGAGSSRFQPAAITLGVTARKVPVRAPTAPCLTMSVVSMPGITAAMAAPGCMPRCARKAERQVVAVLNV